MMKSTNLLEHTILLGIVIMGIGTSCQKEIEIQIPPPKQKLCVDGRIEPGHPPYVILTRNQPYFGPTDINTLENIFVHNAVVTISDGIHSSTLTEFCTKNLPPALLAQVSSVIGIDTNSLKNFNYCFYTTLDTLLWGKTGETYSLTVSAEGKVYTSVTSILLPVPLDSLWYRYEKTNSKGDSLGFVWAHLTDPPQPGNAYRWLAKRIGKDFSFVPPPGSVFDDRFINGKSFDFAYNRGELPNYTAPGDTPEEEGYFKKGDTVVIKFCTIDLAAFEFFRNLSIVLSNEGNPFASPLTIPTNIFPAEESLGIWCGYGVSLDTVILK